MTPAELANIGRTLYGKRWQAPLARALGVDHMTVYRWFHGKRTMPLSRQIACRMLMDRRESLLD